MELGNDPVGSNRPFCSDTAAPRGGFQLRAVRRYPNLPRSCSAIEKCTLAYSPTVTTNSDGLKDASHSAESLCTLTSPKGRRIRNYKKFHVPSTTIMNETSEIRWLMASPSIDLDRPLFSERNPAVSSARVHFRKMLLKQKRMQTGHYDRSQMPHQRG